MKSLVAMSVLVFALTACGGGGSTGSIPNANIGSSAMKTGSVALTIKVPSASAQSTQRRPAYVSPATQSISVTPRGGSTQLFAIGQSAPGCTTPGGALTCTFSVSAPTGRNVAIVIATYANAAGTGTPLSSATVIATVISGQSNPVNATLNGVVTALSVALNPAAVPPGTPATVQVIVNALDASGNAIVGPGVYADTNGNPVTISLSKTDSSNSTTLSQTMLTQPTSGVTLAYNGSSSFASATVTAGAANIPSKTATLVGKASTGTFAEFKVPAGSLIQDITAGPDGNLWFTEESAKLGRVTPSGTVTEFPLPSPLSTLRGITAGADGNLWFADQGSNKIGRITPGGVVTEFSLLTANSAPNGIAAGSDGNLWFTEFSANNIGRITPSGVVTEFPIPSINTQPVVITAGPDGNLWFTENRTRAIGRITPAGTITEFPVPQNLNTGLTTGPDGNLWFTEFDTQNKIGQITPSGVVREFVGLSGNDARGVTAGPDGAVWFTEADVNKVGRITPSGAITEFSIPTANSHPSAITKGPDGNLWFVEDNVSKIGRITP
ncbi:MAG: hypothetical protein M3N13_01100 [Candidatus Eremiobacteraeota bacterium]|nr:hypothetical protein [Candidatus Eremiobacteraeota bacterium]